MNIPTNAHSGKHRKTSRSVDIHIVCPMLPLAPITLVIPRIVKDVELGTLMPFATHRIRQIGLASVEFEEGKVLGQSFQVCSFAL